MDIVSIIGTILAFVVLIVGAILKGHRCIGAVESGGFRDRVHRHHRRTAAAYAGQGAQARAGHVEDGV